MRRVGLSSPGTTIVLLLSCAIIGAASAVADDAPSVPPLDAAPPAETRTATFALG